MSEPAYTPFERALDETADPIFNEGKTGYAWSPVDELLLKEFDQEDLLTRCKKATGSGRAANVLTESNDKEIDLYLVFIGHTYSRDAFLDAAADRIRRFPNVQTVAIADHTGPRWRVTAIIEREGVGLAERLRTSFPAVSDEDIHLVPADLEDDGQGPTSTHPTVVPAVDREVFESKMLGYETELEGLNSLPTAFRGFADKAGVLLDLATATDLLASMLSSQMLLFAGPSGTGKSVSARLLQRFFAPEERSRVFEARRQWLSPDDLVGYYSVLGDQFATTPDTEKLIDLHEASIAPVRGGGSEVEGPPVLLVEEINLSPPEGYLAPLVHGLSGVAEPFIYWVLHSRATGAVDQASVITLPETAMLGPFPRLLGTINVDATAQAPARKVAARSCVLLLEPGPITDGELEALVAASMKDEVAMEAGAAKAFLGNPLGALGSLAAEDGTALQASLLALADQLGGTLISRRDALRCLAYMAYFQLLAPSDTDTEVVRMLAAENAILHCVLPTIDADRFASALQALSGAALMAEPGNHDALGGLLASRVSRLLELSGGLGFADALDFWAALS